MWQPEFPALALDPSIACRAMLGFTALLQGRPEAGAEWIRNTLDHANAMNSPYNLSYARELAAQYCATAGERKLALEHATAAAALAAEHGFVIHAAVAEIVRGWAMRDVAVLREGIGEYEGAGQYVATSFFGALLVEVLLEQEQVQDALAELATIVAFVERSGERRHLPELYRLEGECLRRSSSSSDIPRRSEPEAAFQRALSIAREQGARLWELRATTSLAAFRASRGERRDARGLLDDAVRPFAEGCDLPDLRQARALRSEF